MVPPATVVAATRSASDSNLRCGKEEWPACSWLSDKDLPRPNLIFVAAEKNGPPTAVVAATSSASDSNFLCGNRELFRLQTVVSKPELHRFLISGGQFENRCMVLPGNLL